MGRFVRLLLSLGALLWLILLNGCQTSTTRDVHVSRSPVIAVALGGGGAKGFAHIGVLKVLEQNGIKPNIVVGTSAGSLIGSLYASGINPYQLQKLGLALNESDLRQFAFSRQGILSGVPIKNFVNKNVHDQPIEKFPIPFAAVATQLKTGQLTVFNKGNAGSAVAASCSIPNVFVPAQINGEQYVDGGLVSPIPASVARKLGADIVIAVDISARPSKSPNLSLTGILDQTLNIMSQGNIRNELSQADIVIAPAVTQYGTLDLTQKNNSILAGEQAAQAQIANIKQAIANFKNSPAAQLPQKASVYK